MGFWCSFKEATEAGFYWNILFNTSCLWIELHVIWVMRNAHVSIYYRKYLKKDLCSSALLGWGLQPAGCIRWPRSLQLHLQQHSAAVDPKQSCADNARVDVVICSFAGVKYYSTFERLVWRMPLPQCWSKFRVRCTTKELMGPDFGPVTISHHRMVRNPLPRCARLKHHLNICCSLCCSGWRNATCILVASLFIYF